LLKIQKVNKITDCQHINMFEISYLDMNGEQKHWQMVSRCNEPKCVTGQFGIPDAVVIVPFHKKENKLVLIKEFRVAIGNYQYGFPAGLVDEGETIHQASQRELKEETGLNVTGFLKTGPPVYSSTGITDESVSMVYVECDGEPSNKHNESSEDITTILLSSKEAYTLCRDTTLMFDVKTWIILSSFAEDGRI
jgi:ADP-ribose pyrophosphatase